MPSLYVGGYFSQLVISALYPVLDTVAVGRVFNGEVVHVQALESPYDKVHILETGSVLGVDLITILAPNLYTNTEPGAKLTGGAITAVNLVTTIAFLTYSNAEPGAKLTGGAITAVNLVATITFVTYSNTELGGKLTAGSITGVSLV